MLSIKKSAPYGADGWGKRIIKKFGLEQTLREDQEIVADPISSRKSPERCFFDRLS